MSVKHFITLNTVADNQRERLLSAPLSATAYRLIEEIVRASEKKLAYLGWAMYGIHPGLKWRQATRSEIWLRRCQSDTACAPWILFNWQRRWSGVVSDHADGFSFAVM